MEGACLTEASMSAVRQGARLVLPGADTSISVWRGFVGGLHDARLVLPGADTGPSVWRVFLGGLQFGRRRWIGIDIQGLGHPKRCIRGGDDGLCGGW